MTKVLELFGIPTGDKNKKWNRVVSRQECPYLHRKCLKVRKSTPDISIGTCTVSYGREDNPVMICPYRLLEKGKVFTDCFHLLTSHEPGNELHIVPEVSLPGGTVDYFLVSVRNKKVRDFVGIEFQTMDTTGTVWPERQRFLHRAGVPVSVDSLESDRSFGMNWKMTAKTTLVQLHHKTETFEHINKRLVLVLQDSLLKYMRSQFRFNHIQNAKLGDPMHFHAYKIACEGVEYRISLVERASTDIAGISDCLGLQAEAKVELTEIIRQLESKLSNETIFTLQ